MEIKMKDPVLVIMAAGMGSRYGGLKQIDPVDEQGHIIMDFSVYDAMRAGFKKVVFVIKKENEALFREVIGDRVSEKIQVAYAHQNLDALPEGYAVPADRVKPWGTGHAVLCAKDAVDGAPFAVINADDYYGKEAFQLIYDYLSTHEDDDRYRFTMVGYSVKNTVTENGHVSRGVCQTDENQYLTEIVERTRIEKRGDGAAWTEDDGATWNHLDGDTIVSMNMWGFSAPFMAELEKGFPAFLDQAMAENPLKGEYFLPSAVEKLLTSGKATVEVLHTPDKWYGVTYKEDKPVVMEAMQKMKADGVYPAEF